MDYFNYQGDDLFCEDYPLVDLAKKYETPLYVYSRKTLERHWMAFDNALKQQPHLICYAVKANSNLAVLNCLARLGSGFDVVSGGELERVLAAGGDANKIVFSGVGKKTNEIQRALEAGIFCFNVESESELQQLAEIAATMQKKVRVAIRVNPDVDAKTHPYIATGLHENKFGIEIEQAKQLYIAMQNHPWLKLIGIDCHIGSQLTELGPFLDALKRLLQMVAELKQHNIDIQQVDIGGGLGVRYADETPPHPNEYAEALLQELKQYPHLMVILEPGRAIVANAGVLITEVIHLKKTPKKNFVIVDAGMNDLLRPALYEAWQDIIPLRKNNESKILYDVVGPVCETSDFLGKARELSVKKQDYLAVRGAGAYGFAMSSNYNTRPRAAEVMIDGQRAFLVRERETVNSLYEKERILP